MLGAEGVKSVVINRLKLTMPTAISAVAARFGAAPGEIPTPTNYYPSAVPAFDVPAGAFPFVTVNVSDTDGELSTEILTAHEIVEEYQLGYNVVISVYTMVSGLDGEPLARLQAERLVLAIRECLLWERDLDPPGEDQAIVNFGRWAEEYDTALDETAGAWKGGAGLVVPVVTSEILDRAPYIDRLAYLVGQQTYAQDPVTGAEIAGTRHTDIEPRPDTL